MRAIGTTMAARAVRAAAALAVLAVVAVLGGLTACTSAVGSQGAPDKGYISGDGTVSVTSPYRRGDPATFQGPTLAGGHFDVVDHRGEVVVVNFWASWCPPCIKEAPDLQRVSRDYGSRGVQFVGVDVGDQQTAARAHERRFGITYPSISDPDGRVLLAFRGTLTPSSRPSTLVLDRDGRVAARVLGRVDGATLRGLVDDVLAEHRP